MTVEEQFANIMSRKVESYNGERGVCCIGLALLIVIYIVDVPRVKVMPSKSSNWPVTGQYLIEMAVSVKYPIIGS